MIGSKIVYLKVKDDIEAVSQVAERRASGNGEKVVKLIEYQFT